jgi:hypothetical protein
MWSMSVPVIFSVASGGVWSSTGMESCTSISCAVLQTGRPHDAVGDLDADRDPQRPVESHQRWRAAGLARLVLRDDLNDGAGSHEFVDDARDRRPGKADLGQRATAERSPLPQRSHDAGAVGPPLGRRGFGVRHANEYQRFASN